MFFGNKVGERRSQNGFFKVGDRSKTILARSELIVEGAV